MNQELWKNHQHYPHRDTSPHAYRTCISSSFYPTKSPGRCSIFNGVQTPVDIASSQLILIRLMNTNCAHSKICFGTMETTETKKKILNLLRNIGIPFQMVGCDPQLADTVKLVPATTCHYQILLILS